MKHPATERRYDASRLVADARQVDCEIDADQAALMLRHLEMLLEANTSLNLTAVTQWDEACVKHIVDSLSAVPAVDAAPAGSLLDLGSGGGYPGVPLCIATGRQTVLLESVRKKANFLADVVSSLRLNATVQPLRSEERALAAPAEHACVVVRAVAKLPALVELASPLLQPMGLLVALKAGEMDEEISGARAVGDLTGMKLQSVMRVELPGLVGSRSLVVFRREGLPRVVLPRRPGMAVKRPL